MPIILFFRHAALRILKVGFLFVPTLCPSYFSELVFNLFKKMYTLTAFLKSRKSVCLYCVTENLLSGLDKTVLEENYGK